MDIARLADRILHLAWVTGALPEPGEVERQCLEALLGHPSCVPRRHLFLKARKLHQTGEKPQVGCSGGARSGGRRRRLEVA